MPSGCNVLFAEMSRTCRAHSERFLKDFEARLQTLNSLGDRRMEIGIDPFLKILGWPFFMLSFQSNRVSLRAEGDRVSIGDRLDIQQTNSEYRIVSILRGHFGDALHSQSFRTGIRFGECRRMDALIGTVRQSVGKPPCAAVRFRNAP